MTSNDEGRRVRKRGQIHLNSSLAPPSLRIRARDKLFSWGGKGVEKSVSTESSRVP